MKTSEKIDLIASALVAFHDEVTAISKTAKNPFFKNEYAPLGHILNTIKEPLTNNKLTVLQFPVGENGLNTIILHQSGQYISESYEMPAAKQDPQGHGSRITYQKRYAISSILGLSFDVDDDGQEASKEQAKPKLTETQLEAVLKYKEGDKYVKDGKEQPFANIIKQLESKYTISESQSKKLIA